MIIFENVLLPFFTSLGITLFAIPPIIHTCKTKRLFDEPCQRKHHISPIPSFGGIAIFAGFSFSLLFWSPGQITYELKYIICSSLIIFFMGLKDDLIEISPFKKIIGQMFSALIIVLFADIRLTGLYGAFGTYELSYLASTSLSVFTIILITNSFNLIDGVDGLASSVGIVSTVLFGSWFLVSGHLTYSITAFSLTGSHIAFLHFNRHPAKIFMGDTGSLILGLICSILAIKFIELNGSYAGPEKYKILSVPAIAISILIIPIFDTLQVVAFRLINKKSPFYPDKNHLHHILSKMNFSDRKICALLIGLNIFIFAFSFLFQQITAEIIILCYLAFLVIFVLVCRKIA